MENIDPSKNMNKEDFCELFEQLPLLEDEREKVASLYWGIYTKLVEHPEVEPTDAWLATRNSFIAQETQIKERMEKSPLSVVK